MHIDISVRLGFLELESCDVFILLLELILEFYFGCKSAKPHWHFSHRASESLEFLGIMEAKLRVLLEPLSAIYCPQTSWCHIAVIRHR